MAGDGSKEVLSTRHLEQPRLKQARTSSTATQQLIDGAIPLDHPRRRANSSSRFEVALELNCDNPAAELARCWDDLMTNEGFCAVVSHLNFAPTSTKEERAIRAWKWLKESLLMKDDIWSFYEVLRDTPLAPKIPHDIAKALQLPKQKKTQGSS